jgi:hypothetical protein
MQHNNIRFSKTTAVLGLADSAIQLAGGGTRLETHLRTSVKDLS